MIKKFLEAGKIVNTHGIGGEVRIQPWCDSPEFLCAFDAFYIDGQAVKAENLRVHKGCVLAQLGGAADIKDAIKLKGRIICIDRDSVRLSPGANFISDLIGLDVIDDDTGERLGVIAEVFFTPANDVYAVRGVREYLIPAVGQFIKETNVEGGYMRVHIIGGMATDEN